MKYLKHLTKKNYPNLSAVLLKCGKVADYK